MLDEFQTTNHSIQQQRGTLQDFWILAPAYSYKVNVDGATFSQNQQAGVGVVVKEHEDRVMAAISKKIHQPLGPLEIEAKAMEEGISFAWDIGLHEVILIQKL